jgi:hypothetical protein
MDRINYVIGVINGWRLCGFVSIHVERKVIELLNWNN